MSAIKNPIEIVCINSKRSTKLINGATYLATKIWSFKDRSGIITRRVSILNIGHYLLDYFELPNGKPLSTIRDFEIKRIERLNTENKNFTGQLVKCKYSSGTSLKKDEIYFVEEQRSIEHRYYNNKIYHDVKLKIRGIKNLVNPYRFEEISLAEQRNIKLKKLKGEKIKTGEQTRKFLLYNEKEKIFILFEILTGVLFDIQNIEKIENKKIDLIELMVKKGKKYALLEEDIKPFLKERIETIFKSICF